MLIVPLIQPDELLRGYLHRMLTPNGMRSHQSRFIAQQLKAQLSNYKENNLQTGTKKLFLLAHALNISPEKLILEHTMGPVQAFVRDTCTNKLLPTTAYLLSYNRFKPKGFQFCETCVKEDLATHGFSYWRRIHNFLGVQCCLYHQNALVRAKALYPWEHPPSFFINSPFVSEIKIVSSEMLAWQARFTSFVAYILNNAPCISYVEANRIVRNKAGDLGYTNACFSHFVLENEIIEKSSVAWLSDMVPKIFVEEETTVPVFNRDTRLVKLIQEGNTLATLVTANHLFQGPHEFFQAAEAQRKAQRKAQQEAQQGAQRMDKGQLNQSSRGVTNSRIKTNAVRPAYVAAKGVPSRIAQKLGCSTLDVEEWLKKNGYIGVPEGTQGEQCLTGLYAFLVEKKSLESSAREAGMPLEKLADLFRSPAFRMSRVLYDLYLES